MKLTALAPQLVGRAGGEVTCRLKLERTTNFAGPMQLELAAPAAAAGIRARPVTIRAGETTAEVQLQIGQQVVAEAITLQLRATGQLTPEIMVVSEASLPLAITR